MKTFLGLLTVLSAVMNCISVKSNPCTIPGQELRYFCKHDYFDGVYYDGFVYRFSKRLSDSTFQLWTASYRSETSDFWFTCLKYEENNFLPQSGFYIEDIPKCEAKDCNDMKKLKALKVEIYYHMKWRYSAYILSPDGGFISEDQLPYGLKNSSELVENPFWPKDLNMNKVMYKPTAFRLKDHTFYYIINYQDSSPQLVTNTLTNKLWPSVTSWKTKPLNGYKEFDFIAMFSWIINDAIYAVLDPGIENSDISRVGFVFELNDINSDHPFVDTNKTVKDLFGCAVDTGGAGSVNKKPDEPTDNPVLIIAIIIVIFFGVVLIIIFIAIYTYFSRKRRHSSKESISSLSDVKRLDSIRRESSAETANISKRSESSDRSTQQYSRSHSKYSKKSPISPKSSTIVKSHKNKSEYRRN